MTESRRDEALATLDESVEAGEGWVHELSAGHYLRIVDLHGNQAVDTLFFNAHDYADRYSAVNTITAQRNAYLSTGSRLLSARGTPLLEIVADTCGRHDTLGGACAQESNDVRYGREARFMHACRDTFLRCAREWGHGLEARDLAPNINFFMNVPIGVDGSLRFADGISEAGRYVELRAEADVLVLISNCPQLNNPCNAYNPTPIRVLTWPC